MRLIFTFCGVLLLQVGFGQGVGIGNALPDSSAVLDISSGTKGILIPRMGRTDIFNIPRPAPGLLIYDKVQNQLFVNMGTADLPVWHDITATSAWGLSGNEGINTGQFIGTLDSRPLVFRVGNVFSGIIDSVNRNTALGLGALAVNKSSGNSAIGAGALGSNINGKDNIAMGLIALGSNTSGFDNEAVGFGSLYLNTTGAQNCAVGDFALSSNQGGASNTAIGAQSLQSTTNSSFNTVVGANSAASFDNGYNNVFLGANNDVNGAGYYNVIAIGQGVVCTASSQARIGNSATNSIGGYANWTNFSDGRYKKNMKENVKGIDFIMRLRPVTYNLDVTGIENKLGTKRPKDAGSQAAISDKAAMVFSGFAAQEVEQAAREAGYDFSGVDKPKSDKDFYGLRYADFVVPLVKAVQEQQKMINIQNKRLDQLEQENKALMTLLNTKK
jgi:hypothetical protein